MSEQSSITQWDIFPFEGEIRLKELQPPVLPEPPRSGDPDGEPCFSCGRDDDTYLWTDDDWRLSVRPQPSAVPFVILETREHHDLTDMPPRLSAALGPMLQRIESAFMNTGGFGRVHINKWGDGSAHFHIWLFGRPLGSRQLLGVFLPVWNAVLPPMADDAWRDIVDAIGSTLEAGGGTRHLTREEND